MASEAHCLYAFDVLEHHLLGKGPSKSLEEWQKLSLGVYEHDDSKASLTAKSVVPIFVTWNTLRPSGKRLRGCIGTFKAQPLEKVLTEYSVTAAVQDSRFRPVTAKELPTMSCGISILSDFEPIEDPFDWTIGQHGLQVYFLYKGRGYSSTYLPSVAEEQGWSKEDTLRSLLHKGGFDGKSADWRSLQLDLERYQSSKHEITYERYKELQLAKQDLRN